MNFAEKIRELYSDNVEMLKMMIEEREYFRLVLFQNFHPIKMFYLSGYKKKYEEHCQKALCKIYDEIIEHFDEISGLKEDFETEIINYLNEYYATITSVNTEFIIDFTRYKNLGKYMKKIYR